VDDVWPAEDFEIILIYFWKVAGDSISVLDRKTKALFCKNYKSHVLVLSAGIQQKR
jgi:hypothetical protein